MSTKYVDKTVRLKHGSEISFTITNDLLMIHSKTFCCQYPRESTVSIMDDGKTHGILRLMNTDSLQTAMSLYIHYGDAVSLQIFLATHLRNLA